MPGFNGTGPRGMGPMTGGGRGFCNPWGIGAAARSYGAPPRLGYGYPYYGAWQAAPGAIPFAPQMSREQELEMLKTQSQTLAQQLDEIQRQIKELEKKPK